MQPAPRPAPPADIWDDSDPAAQVSPPPVGPQVGDHDGSRTRRWWQHPILIIGMLVVFFRYKSIFAGGVAFSILFGNMVAPSLDFWIKRIRSRGKAPEAK